MSLQPATFQPFRLASNSTVDHLVRSVATTPAAAPAGLLEYAIGAIASAPGPYPVEIFHLLTSTVLQEEGVIRLTESMRRYSRTLSAPAAQSLEVKIQAALLLRAGVGDHAGVVARASENVPLARQVAAMSSEADVLELLVAASDPSVRMTAAMNKHCPAPLAVECVALFDSPLPGCGDDRRLQLLIDAVTTPSLRKRANDLALRITTPAALRRLAPYVTALSAKLHLVRHFLAVTLQSPSSKVIQRADEVTAALLGSEIAEGAALYPYVPGAPFQAPLTVKPVVDAVVAAWADAGPDVTRRSRFELWLSDYAKLLERGKPAAAIFELDAEQLGQLADEAGGPWTAFVWQTVMQMAPTFEGTQAQLLKTALAVCRQ